MGSSPQGRRDSALRFQRRLRQLWRAMVEVSRSGSARRMIFCRNVRQSSARIDSTACKVLNCRDFVRTVLSCSIDRLWTATECARVLPAYRTLENIAFCRRFCSMIGSHG